MARQRHDILLPFTGLARAGVAPVTATERATRARSCGLQVKGHEVQDRPPGSQRQKGFPRDGAKS